MVSQPLRVMPDIQANFQVLLLITDIQNYARENKTHMSITDFSIPQRHAHAFILFLNMQKKHRPDIWQKYYSAIYLNIF
jgi:hypothetical protein